MSGTRQVAAKPIGGKLLLLSHFGSASRITVVISGQCKPVGKVWVVAKGCAPGKCLFGFRLSLRDVLLSGVIFSIVRWDSSLFILFLFFRLSHWDAPLDTSSSNRRCLRRLLFALRMHLFVVHLSPISIQIGDLGLNRPCGRYYSHNTVMPSQDS